MIFGTVIFISIRTVHRSVAHCDDPGLFFTILWFVSFLKSWTLNLLPKQFSNFIDDNVNLVQVSLWKAIGKNCGKRRKCWYPIPFKLSNMFHCWTIFQTSPGFYLSAVQVLWKKLGEMEKSLVRNNFSFSQCFLLIWRTFCHFHQIWNWNLEFVVWERVKPNFICLWNSYGSKIAKSIIFPSSRGVVITLSQTTNFRLLNSKPSPIAQLVALRTWEQEVAGLIPSSANILSKDWG